jgi:putative transposase
MILLRNFYASLRLHPGVGPIFEKHVKDWPSHFETIADFWSQQTGGPKDYPGGLMAAHMILRLRPEHFTAWLAQWEQSCRLHFEEREAEELIGLARRIGGKMADALTPKTLECGSLLPLSKDDAPSPALPWPHAPTHRLGATGTYMVTSGTYGKEHLFKDGPKLQMLHRALITIAHEHGWQLEAWAIFPNHYHFIAHSPPRADTLIDFLKELHSRTAIALNRQDNQPARKVWHNYWESLLTHENSYLARLHYVHQNPVRHGVVTLAKDYPYGSAQWFEKIATQAQVKTVYSFKTDQLKIQDDY